MSSKKNRNHWLLIGKLLAGMFLGTCVAAAPAISQGSIPMGYVDLDALLEGYQKYQKANKEFEEYQNMGRQRILARRFLTWDEWKQLDLLEERVEKGEKLKEAEQNELARLGKLSEERETRLKELQGIREPTDDQKRERQELESLEKGNSSRLQQLGQDLARKGNEKFSKVLNELQDNVRKAIAEVAKNKSLKFVIDKKKLLWADPALEITNDILKILNAS